MALPKNTSLMERIETTIIRNLIFNEEYFTEDILQKLDVIAKEEFSYGM